MSQETLISRLTAIFALLAVLLAAIGLYGVMSFNVVRRSNGNRTAPRSRRERHRRAMDGTSRVARHCSQRVSCLVFPSLFMRLGWFARSFTT